MPNFDDDLVRDVTNELFFDPKVDNASVTVSAHDGRVTLSGRVGSFREKREAKKAAERVLGVISVDNDLHVRYSKIPTDKEIRDNIRGGLLLDLAVPASVQVDVSDGIATLSGTAEWQYQREEAELVASNIAGVVDVFDEIALTNPRPDAFDVKQSIKDAFKRHATLDADAVSVSSSDGTVTLQGTVHSWAEHDEAVDAAWAAPGVRTVDDQLSVSY
jgi:osmotically-inducible protein OsmY